MKVYSFFRAVAEGVVAQGIRGLAQEVPGGKYFVQLAEFALARYKQLRQQGQLRDDVREMVADEFAKHQQNAKAAVDEVAPPNTPVEDRVALELFLAQIPAAARKTFARPEDPSGRTVPAAFALNTADDVLKMLPPAPPKLRPGMPL
ncbi:MAG TPA: hypothetical protein VMZ71_00810, partial [Gemmataceae bacterium]|nr:hypothetical protein [Gemmataceae bacterium]